MMKFLNPFFLFYVWVLLVWLFRARRALETLARAPEVSPEDTGSLPGRAWPRLSVIIPAKNEEANVGPCIQGLLDQDYPGEFEIIVINDNSEDKTEAILIEKGAMSIESLHKSPQTARPKLLYLNSPPPPEGWTGKNHALHQARDLATGEWLLFTDADTRHEPAGLRASVFHAVKEDYALLTLLPRCLTKGPVEALIQPTAMTFMGLWFPLQDVNNPSLKNIYFGNGQYLLIHRKLYTALGGHEAVCHEFLEDFALARDAKQAGARTCCAIGKQVYATRMYDSFHAIRRGWRRIYLHAFRKKPEILAKKALECVLFSVLPFILFFPLARKAALQPEAYGLAFGFSVPVLTFILAVAWKSYHLIRARLPFALGHPVAAAVIAGILTDASLMALRRRKTKWR